MRFPEFEGKWEEKDFEQICTITTGNKNTQDKEDDGCYPFYVRSETIEKINSYSFDGEAILTAGDGVGVGKIFHYINGKVGVHQRVYILSNFKCFGKYAYYYFASRFYDRVKRMSAKNSVDSVRRDMIAQMPISLPGFDEQNIIARFLTLLDERITTQNKIIEDLKLLKSTISEKLFNRHLRFEKLDGGTSSDWRIQKLGDFMTIPDKIPTPKIDKNKLLTVKLHLKGVIKNDSTESLSTQGTVYYVRQKGQFIYGKQNLFNGALGIIPNEYDGFLSSNDVPTLNINSDKINPFYLLYYIGRKNYYVPLESLAIGSGSKRIHESTVLNLEIAVPTLKEQSIIVSAICSIDKKIEIETFVLKGLNFQKQYLLSNVFV